MPIEVEAGQSKLPNQVPWYEDNKPPHRATHRTNLEIYIVRTRQIIVEKTNQKRKKKKGKRTVN
jgi:hypothetical protein